MTPNESELELAEKIAERIHGILRTRRDFIANAPSNVVVSIYANTILDEILQHNRKPIKEDECKVDQ